MPAVSPRPPWLQPPKSVWILSALAFALLAGFTLWLFWSPPLAPLRTTNPSWTRLMAFRAWQARQRQAAFHADQRWVDWQRISPALRQTVLLAEDDVFYQHAGVDLNATWLSFRYNLKHRGFFQGGSTITQQVVKNLFLTPRKSLPRKLKEALLSLRLERVLGKRRILEIYLNIAEWGPGIFGAEAAARHYFQKSAADLTWEEAVLLVSVLPSPLRHSPLRPDRFLQWRSAWVWRQLRSAGYAQAVTPPAEPAAPEILAEVAAEEEAAEEYPWSETPRDEQSLADETSAPAELSKPETGTAQAVTATAAGR